MDRVHDKAYHHMMTHLSAQQKEIWHEEQRRSRVALGLEAEVPPTKAKKTESAFEVFSKLTKSQRRHKSIQEHQTTPRAADVTVSPVMEVPPELSNQATTSPGGDDNHTHTAFYDEAGNGYTDYADDGHYHFVRGFVVTPYQNDDGVNSHTHEGNLPIPARTPGAEYKDYTGQV